MTFGHIEPMTDSHNRSRWRLLLKAVVPFTILGGIASLEVYRSLPVTYEADARLEIACQIGLKVTHDAGAQAHQTIVTQTIRQFRDIHTNEGISDGTLVETLLKHTKIQQMPLSREHRFVTDVSDEELLDAMATQQRSEDDPWALLPWRSVFRIAVRSDKPSLAVDLANAYAMAIDRSTEASIREANDRGVRLIISKVEESRRRLERANLALKSCQTTNVNETAAESRQREAREQVLTRERNAAETEFRRLLQIEQEKRMGGGEHTSPIRIIQNANASAKKASPKLGIVLSAGMVAGALLGGVVALVLFTAQKDRPESKHGTGMPRPGVR